MSMYSTFSELKDFEKTDWYGYAGAEKLPDGSEPKISRASLCGWGADLIVDGQGIELDLYQSNPEEVNYTYLIECGNLHTAARVAAANAILVGLRDVTATHDIDEVFKWMKENYPTVERDEV